MRWKISMVRALQALHLGQEFGGRFLLDQCATHTALTQIDSESEPNRPCSDD